MEQRLCQAESWQRLTAIHQQVLTLRAVSGRSYTQIANLLQSTVVEIDRLMLEGLTALQLCGTEWHFAKRTIMDLASSTGLQVMSEPRT